MKFLYSEVFQLFVAYRTLQFSCSKNFTHGIHELFDEYVDLVELRLFIQRTKI